MLISQHILHTSVHATVHVSQLLAGDFLGPNSRTASCLRRRASQLMPAGAQAADAGGCCPAGVLSALSALLLLLLALACCCWHCHCRCRCPLLWP